MHNWLFGVIVVIIYVKLLMLNNVKTSTWTVRPHTHGWLVIQWIYQLSVIFCGTTGPTIDIQLPISQTLLSAYI